jgi:hypothetical protein
MYQGTFPAATTDADWAFVVSLTDESTGQEYDASDLEFTLNVVDCGTAVLSATTEAGTLTRPDDHQVAWRFSAAQMAALCDGKTYKVGLISEDDDGHKTQILVMDLPVIDGGIA